MQATKNILVRGIPEKLHKRMKMQALRQDKTLSQAIIDAFILYLKDGRPRKGA